MLRLAGLDDSNYNTHSFRIGATTTAKAMGIADVHIQLLGRWRSSAYQDYIKMPTPVLQKTITAAGVQDHSRDSPHCTCTLRDWTPLVEALLIRSATTRIIIGITCIRI